MRRQPANTSTMINVIQSGDTKGQLQVPLSALKDLAILDILSQKWLTRCASSRWKYHGRTIDKVARVWTICAVNKPQLGLSFTKLPLNKDLLIHHERASSLTRPNLLSIKTAHCCWWVHHYASLCLLDLFDCVPLSLQQFSLRDEI